MSNVYMEMPKVGGMVSGVFAAGQNAGNSATLGQGPRVGKASGRISEKVISGEAE